MKLHVSYGNPVKEEWEYCAALDYPESSRAWIDEGLPPPTGKLPRRSVTLPTGETLELGLFREEESDTTNIFVFAEGDNILQVLGNGAPQIVFRSPGGSHVSVAIYSWDPAESPSHLKT